MIARTHHGYRSSQTFSNSEVSRTSMRATMEHHRYHHWSEMGRGLTILHVRLPSSTRTPEAYLECQTLWPPPLPKVMLGLSRLKLTPTKGERLAAVRLVQNTRLFHRGRTALRRPSTVASSLPTLISPLDKSASITVRDFAPRFVCCPDFVQMYLQHTTTPCNTAASRAFRVQTMRRRWPRAVVTTVAPQSSASATRWQRGSAGAR
jgi:hypothetical protein